MLNKNNRLFFYLLILPAFFACESKPAKLTGADVVPVIVTEKTPTDTDDPAIWYNSENSEKSLILGTDKGDSTGGIFVFDLEGKLDTTRSIPNLKRPNNIDIEYGFQFQGKTIDIAAFTERGRDMIRVISLPDCKFIDNGGIPVFEDDSLRSPMGISLYKDKGNAIYAFVGRKTGPVNGNIYQYRLQSSENSVTGVKVRAFGKFSGKKEIEAIVVDDELGYVYYSDETVGVRQYYADADKGNEELSLFATTGITGDHEGLSIYKESDKSGYIILSDQQANKFQLFTRQGTDNNSFEHRLVRIVKAKTIESDGSEVLNLPLNHVFRKGIFVAMSSDKTFQYYKSEDIVGEEYFFTRLFNKLFNR